MRLGKTSAASPVIHLVRERTQNRAVCGQTLTLAIEVKADPTCLTCRFHGRRQMEKAIETGYDAFRQALEARNSARRTLQTQVVPGVAPEYASSIRALKHEAHVEIYPGQHPLSTKLPVANNKVTDVLVKAILIRALQLRFRAANPDVGTDVVDWHSHVPAHSTFGEGLEVMKRAYPHYEWGRR